MRSARGLATIECAARAVLSVASSMLQARADQLEAVLRLSLGDLRTPAELHTPASSRLRAAACCWPGWRWPTGDHQAAQEHLQAAAQGALTPRRDLERELLLGATAIARGDPAAAGMLGTALHTARRQGFRSTVVTTSPLVTEYLVEHAARLRMDPFLEQLVAVALQLRAAQAATSGANRTLPRAADRRRAAHPPAAADEHLRADRQQPVHIAQHGENPPPVDLSEARGDVARRGGRASRRCAPAVRPRGEAAPLAITPGWVTTPPGRPDTIGKHPARRSQRTRRRTMRIVVALGGNALLRRGDPMTTEIQRKNVAKSRRGDRAARRGHDIVVVHGNGRRSACCRCRPSRTQAPPPTRLTSSTRAPRA